MHGDFSRGHRPDAKRGQTYTRGFAQQRRLLLDSDVNAMTDALHERLRGLARHLGCPKGSPDLGYLPTPGRLLALFRELQGVVTASNNLTFFRDYQNKYLDRYPSLKLSADLGLDGSATVRLREEANGYTVFWCRAETPTAVTLSGDVLNVPAGSELQAVKVNLAAPVQDLVIELHAGDAVWIALIEGFQTATLAPRFDFARGNYYLDGLPLLNPVDATWASLNPVDATWASNLAPPVLKFQVDNPLRDLAASDRLLVYLEGWERHVTFVEDMGVLENALGGDTDTTTRGRAVGQVKLAWVPATFDLEAFSRALDNPVFPNGTLNVKAPPADPNPDPCALPVQGGYTGRDNRFYRFEVHTGGALGTAVLKWSRDNGAELFPVVEATDQTLTFPAATLLQPGDLVEVLTPETIELGDDSPAVLDGATDSFTPSVRSVGRLVRLQAATSSGVGVRFTMRDPNGVAVVTLGALFGLFPSSTLAASVKSRLKVRRWHGHIETTLAPAPNAKKIENGIEVELDGTFAPGDYWQYEARAGTPNANGAFQTSPHGPERDFGPLALMEFDDASRPLILERWLDDRFGPLCELTADDIAFDGDRISSDSDTVQEIIEDLWGRAGGGCCEFTLQPSEGDTAAAIRDILQATQGEVNICLEPGIYRFTTLLEISNRKVGLRGCPRAVLVASGVDPMIRVLENGRLKLEDLVLFGRRADGARVLIDMAGNSESLEARAVGFFIVPNPVAEAGVNTLAVRVNDQEPTAVDPLNPVPITVTMGFAGPKIRLERSIAAASWVISATSLTGLEIRDSFFSCSTGCIWAESLVNTVARATDFLAGVSLDALQAWTPENLLSDGDGLLEQLPTFVEQMFDLGAFLSLAVQSLCIRAGFIARCSICECHLRAGLGIAATWTYFMRLEGNEYFVGQRGIHIVFATATSLSDEHIGGGGPDSIGVQLLRSGGFSMTDCVTSGFRVGVALGAESAGSGTRNLEDVQVQSNRIDTADVGIQLGTADMNSYSGELRRVTITENNIDARAVGVLINAKVTAAGGE